MSRFKSCIAFMVLALVALIAGACTSSQPGPVVASEFHEARVVNMESRPGNDLTEEEVEIFLQGTFVHACARVNHVNQRIDGYTITMEIETDRSGKNGCEDRVGSIADFIHVVPIDADVLKPGVYTVKLGALTTAFEVQ